MTYRNKRIAPTIAIYEQELAEAIDVEPVTTGSGKGEKVDKAKTKAKAQKALIALRERWAVPMQSWQDLYDTWPEDRKPRDMKAAAVAHFAGKDAEADEKLGKREWTMADVKRKVAERDAP